MGVTELREHPGAEHNTRPGPRQNGGLWTGAPFQ
jgi:hypothetical protein